MRARRALVGAMAVLASAAFASGAVAAGDPDRPQATQVDVFVEPAGHPLPDGTYLGYVRSADVPDATVAVDFVALDGDVGNEHGAELVDAGGLALLDLVGPEARPFRITVQEGAIVGLQSADDLLGPQSAKTSLVSWVKKLWSLPLFGSAEL